MKPFYLILIFAFFLFSCDKDEIPDSEIPEWLEPRIEELKTSEQHCWSCNITRYKYNDNYYYNVYCGYWSCMFCEFYDSNGKLVDESEDFNFEDFLTNKKEETIIWSCSNINY